MRDAPRLTWLNGKTFVQSNGGRKNAPGRKTEHKAALIGNAYKDIAIKLTAVENSSPMENGVQIEATAPIED
jgi:hypothetical protein